MTDRPSAAIVTVGSELVEGLRVDTNTAEIARALQRYGFEVTRAVSVGDDTAQLARLLAELVVTTALVITTGGLGPTHDDVTRDAVASALGIGMTSDEALAASLASIVARHSNPQAAEQVLTQALVLHGAEILQPVTGTAPGQLLDTPAGVLVLLPGPPSEMRPMLDSMLERFEPVRAHPRELGVTGLGESDVQMAAQRALASFSGIELTVLAKPGDCRVVLLDEGAGESGLVRAADAVAAEIGEACYSVDASSLAETLVRAATGAGKTLATAESCTGGLVAAAITDVAGLSAAFLGGVVSYANSAKMELLGVPAGMLAQYGAVSEETARAMAEGARERFGADVAVATTGIAGPSGGSPEKPVGLVWFAVATAAGSTAREMRMLGGSRAAIRARATSKALDLLRREVARA